MPRFRAILPWPSSKRKRNSHAVTSAQHETSAPADGVQNNFPSKKPRTSLHNVEGILHALDGWTPKQPLRYLRASSPGPHLLEERVKRGRPSVHKWTSERNNLLIRLITHTNLPLRDFPAILRDDDSDFAPEKDACKDQCQKLYNLSPAELRSLWSKRPAEDDDLDAAFESHRLHKNFEHAKLELQQFMEHGDQRCAPPGQDAEVSNAFECYRLHKNLEHAKREIQKFTEHGNQRGTSTVQGAGLRNAIEKPTLTVHANPTNILTPPSAPNAVGVDNTCVPNIDHRIGGLASPGTESRHGSVVDTDDEKVHREAQETSCSKSKWPSTRKEVAEKLRWPLEKLDYVIGRRSERVRDSFVSRLSYSSKHKQPDGDSRPPTPLVIGTGKVPRLCELLLGVYNNNHMTFHELAVHIEKEIAQNDDLDVNATDDAGLTALHIATAMGCVLAIEALLKAGADPDAHTNAGESISAFSRPFARDRRLDAEHRGRVEFARKIIEDHTRVQGASDSMSKRASLKRSAKHARHPTVQSLPSVQELKDDEEHLGGKVTGPKSHNDQPPPVLDQSTWAGTLGPAEQQNSRLVSQARYHGRERWQEVQYIPRRPDDHDMESIALTYAALNGENYGQAPITDAGPVSQFSHVGMYPRASISERLGNHNDTTGDYYPVQFEASDAITAFRGFTNDSASLQYPSNTVSRAVLESTTINPSAAQPSNTLPDRPLNFAPNYRLGHYGGNSASQHNLVGVGGSNYNGLSSRAHPQLPYDRRNRSLDSFHPQNSLPHHSNMMDDNQASSQHQEQILQRNNQRQTQGYGHNTSLPEEGSQPLQPSQSMPMMNNTQPTQAQSQLSEVGFGANDFGADNFDLNNFDLNNFDWDNLDLDWLHDGQTYDFGLTHGSGVTYEANQ